MKDDKKKKGQKDSSKSAINNEVELNSDGSLDLEDGNNISTEFQIKG